MGKFFFPIQIGKLRVRTKTDDEDAAQTFCREMFISRRQGRPEDHYRVLGVLGSLAQGQGGAG